MICMYSEQRLGFSVVCQYEARGKWPDHKSASYATVQYSLTLVMSLNNNHIVPNQQDASKGVMIRTQQV